MHERTPLVVLVAGPTGAGKSTTAAYLLRGVLAVEEFVNADTIAQGLSAYRPGGGSGGGRAREATMTDPSDSNLTPAERVHDADRMLRAMQRAVREALQDHKRAGNPVAVWDNGCVVWIQPEDIPTFADEPHQDCPSHVVIVDSPVAA
jgi:hypothetical protein